MSFLGKVDYVTDGDTVKISLFFHNELTRLNCQLEEVDTPEIRSGVVRQFGKDVKAILKNMLEGRIVKVEFGKQDKYGRNLGNIFAQT